MAKANSITIPTHNGPVPAQITAEKGANVQLNVFHVPKGAGFFLVFPEGEELKAMNSARKLLEGEPLDADLDITASVTGCLCAGTVALPKFNVAFGTPEVHHAN